MKIILTEHIKAQKKVRIRYDPKVDVVYIRFREGDIAESDEIRNGIIIDYDKKGRPLAIELLDAREIFAGRPEVVVDFLPTDKIAAAI